MDLTNRTFGIIGGTGKLGGALAQRLANAGLKVIIGSRNPDNAREAAARMGPNASGAANAEAAASADVVLITVPFAAHTQTLAEIAPHVGGKIVIDTTVPLIPPKVMRVQLPPETSAAVRAQALLGPDVTVVSGFHNVAAHKLAQGGDIACDVLIFGDDKGARDVAVSVASAVGLKGVHGGALINSVAAEALTSVLIFINKTYSVDGAGIRITGVA